MAVLVFQADRIPRTTTRETWRKIDRWRRVVSKRVGAAAERQLADLMTFGSTRIELRDRVVDRIVSPPLIVYPTPENF